MVNELFCWYKRNLKMKRLTNILAVLLVLCSFGLSPYVTLNAQLLQTRAPDNYADKLRLFDQFVAKQMEKDKIPGLTIGFIKGGEVWVKGFGYADLENKIPAKAESAYRLASVTKTMTGAAIVQLAEKGKINLDAEIQTYVPYYPKQKWAVTVRQLLVHLGGGQTGSGIGADYVTPREVVARIAKNPIQNEPGVKFDYQTSGYNLLGAAIEEASGKSLNEYFRENFWSPLGMKDTQMDNVRDLIPNRVRGYELVKGEIKNAPFIDVSSRFGGGGLIGTVPDMLNWASNAQSGRILSKSWRELMFTPVANSGRRYVGIGDGTWYYTLGWQVFPVNGRFVFYNDGGQIGTNTMVLRIPSQNLTIAFACNIQNIDRMTYVKRLYEAITGETWDISVYTKDKIDEAIYRGMNSTFNYGSLHLDQTTKPFSTDAQELAKSFAYFNRTVNRNSLLSAFQETVSAINDGRHPVADTAFVKVGSFMAMKLNDTFYEDRTNRYRTMGAIPFFADYIEMYKAKPNYPQELKFNEPFEKLVAKWNQDWARTWNDYTRQFALSSDSNLKPVEDKLAKMFSGAEIYPNLTKQFLDLRQSYEGQKDWEKAADSARVAADLYPQSDTTNAYYAISLIVLGKKDEARAPLKKAASINSNGIASAKALNQIAFALAGIRVEAAIDWLKLASEIYPKEAVLYSSLGDFYQKQGQREQAIEAYKKALEADPNFEHAKETLKKLME
jgi:CubicO group peptidase (beta-lactamase class C family)/tetratricopeptide (TPR) repeat protein